MTLHPALQAMVDAAAALPAMHTLPVDVVRAGAAARYKAVPRPDVAHVEDRAVPGPRGPIPVRIYRPDLEPGRPVIVFFHGSGFVICSVETHDGLARQLCRRSGMIVVSVDYALAPENKFPAAPQDCLAATRWVFAHARDFGGDPARIALAGDSVGGTMSAVTAIRLRDAGEPAPRAMLLMYPVTDHPSGGHAFLHRAWSGLRADSREHGVVLEPLPAGCGRRLASACLAEPGREPVAPAAFLRDHR